MNLETTTEQEPLARAGSLTTKTEAEQRQQHVDELLTRLDRETRRRRRIEKVQLIASLVLLAAAIPLFVLKHQGGGHGLPGAGLFSWLANLLNLSVLAIQRRAARESVAAAARDVDDLRYIPPFIDLLQTTSRQRLDREAHQVARGVLTRLLPRLRATDADLLDEPHRVRLRSLLSEARVRRILWHKRPTDDGALSRAILRTLEEIGDVKSLPQMERLAESAPDSAVREAAARAAETLRVLSNQEQNRQTLLRSADSDSTELLRPAGSGSGVEQELLVRPAEE